VRDTEDVIAEPVSISCRDEYRLAGHLWCTADRPKGVVIVNPATGVLARYYHRYARFLASEGFAVLTYDYRGIGGSRPARLGGCGIAWRDWGALDFDAAVTWVGGRFAHAPAVVGHSIGGFLPGFAVRSQLGTEHGSVPGSTGEPGSGVDRKDGAMRTAMLTSVLALGLALSAGAYAQAPGASCAPTPHPTGGGGGGTPGGVYDNSGQLAHFTAGEQTGVDNARTPRMAGGGGTPGGVYDNSGQRARFTAGKQTASDQRFDQAGNPCK